MSTAFGVYFGATSVCLAVSKDGRTEVLANDAGDRTTPAIVAFTERDQIVGLPAKQGLIRNAANTICLCKKYLGVNFEKSKEYPKQSDVTIVEGKQSLPVYEVEFKGSRRQYRPPEIAVMLYKTMLDIAEKHGEGKDTHDAVITVPGYYNKAQRAVISTIAESAGFNILRMINEHSAAVLSYDIGQTDANQSSKVLVYRHGGSSLEVSVVNVISGMYSTLGFKTSTDATGYHFTELLIKYFAAEFKRTSRGADCLENRRSISKLRVASENCKHILSNLQTATCSVESLYDGMDFQANVSRSRFEGLCGPLLQQCMQTVDELLSELDLNVGDITHVILAGGSSKLPSVQAKLSQKFSAAEVLAHIPTDECIAMGAAKQAGLLLSIDEDTMKLNFGQNVLPCVAHDIYIQGSAPTDDTTPKKAVVIQAGTPVPAKRTYTYTLTDDQTDVCLCVCQQDEKLAQVVMRDLPVDSEVNCVFHMKGDGSLHLTCSEPTTSTVESVTIECS